MFAGILFTAVKVANCMRRLVKNPSRPTNKASGRSRGKSGKGCIDLTDRRGVQNLDIQSERRGGLLHLPQRGLDVRNTGRIFEHGDTNGVGYQIMQESQPPGRHLGGEKIGSRDVAAGRARLATRPNWTGSFPMPKAIGIVAVGALAASATVAMLGVTITATCRRTRSAINAGTR
jgi:hypothetical protein